MLMTMSLERVLHAASSTLGECFTACILNMRAMHSSNARTCRRPAMPRHSMHLSLAVHTRCRADTDPEAHGNAPNICKAMYNAYFYMQSSGRVLVPILLQVYIV